MATRTVQWPASVAVYYPGSDHDAFTNATQRWSIYAAPSFDSVVQPKTEQEVAEVVKTARASNVPFLATGGRHGYTTTLGALKGGVAVDLSKMNEFSIDAAAATVTVGPGVKIADITGPMLEAGYGMGVGSCSAVAVIGGTLGAGVGIFQGVFGLMIDALLSARIVTADGNVVEASASSNPDLFWGIRGAGANFGIITSATYKLSKAVNDGQVFTADMIFPAGARADYFAALKTFENAMPAELAINTSISWSATANEAQIIATFIYSGPESQARQVLAPFFRLNAPVARVSVVPYAKVSGEIIFGIMPAMSAMGRIHDVFSTRFRRFSIEAFNAAFEKLDAFYKAYPDGRASVCLLETFSDHAVAAVAIDATAYPWRDSKGNFMLKLSWPELGNPVETAGNALGRELRDQFAATSGYPDLSVYVSYAHGDEKIEQIYGKERMPRLAALKKQWDPENVFKYNNALPTEYP